MTARALSARLTAFLIALLSLAAFAASPAGAANKPYSLTIAPSSVQGGATVEFTATFTNLTDTQQLGSANLTPPTGFTLQTTPAPTFSGPAAATATAMPDGNVLQLRGLAVPTKSNPNNSVTVKFSVAVPCASGSPQWAVEAKQANDFNGPPGNDLTLNGRVPTTTVTGCAPAMLAFVQQPADARTGQRITGTPFDSTDTDHFVSVEVEDATGARVTSSPPTTITMTLGPSTGVGALHGTTTVVTVNGVATFSDLSIDAPGGYTLRATSTGLQGATSTPPFNIQDAAVQCIEDKLCSTGDVPKNLVSTNTTATPIAGQPDAGFLTVSYDLGPIIECQGYTEFSPDQAEIQGPNRPKVVAFRVDKSLMNAKPNNGASFLNMCFRAPYSFITKPGTLAVETPAGSGFFVGLLPDCGVAPCVSARNKNQSGDGIITVNVAARADDPAFRP